MFEGYWALWEMDILLQDLNRHGASKAGLELVDAVVRRHATTHLMVELRTPTPGKISACNMSSSVLVCHFYIFYKIV